jgi:hypothetical protein
MRPLAAMVLLLTAMPVADAGGATPGFEGRACKPPQGHRVTDCRVARHGTPDLSRAAYRALRDEEVTISVRIEGLMPNPAAGGARSWPLVDSLGQPIGALESAAGRFTVVGSGGARYRAFTVNVRGHGCAASPDQGARFTLVQFIAGRAPSGGGQAFLDSAALEASSLSGRAALTAFVNQRGGGTGCGPARREIGRVRRLADPRLPRTAHARLSNGRVNDAKEYNAKREFGDVVYFMSNTTSVSVGGIARGMVRVGTPVAKADAFAYCDPNSDGTLIWRYWSIRTQDPANPRLYGWIPGRCPAALAKRRAS